MAAKPKHTQWKEHVYEGMTLNGNVPAEALDALKDFDLSGDVLIATYPKTGTTWTQELMWLVHTEGDFDSTYSRTVIERFPWIDMKMDGQPPVIEQVATLPHPRLLKTHMPATLFKKQLSTFSFKVVLVIRNPKDTLVSLYHMYRMWSGLGNYTGSWDEFFDEMVKTKETYCGDYFNWYMSWAPYKDNPNLKIVRYEDLSKNLEGVVEDMAKFIDKNINEEMKGKILKHLSFSQMKDNKMTNYDSWNGSLFDFDISPFMRKGKVGDWKNYFDKEQSEFIDKQYKDTLEKAGLYVEFE